METPCIKVCKVEGSYCLGCGRSIKQLRRWSKYTDEQRKKIIEELSNGKSIRQEQNRTS